MKRGGNSENVVSRTFLKSTDSLSATHHGWVTKKILGPSSSRTAISAVLGPILIIFKNSILQRFYSFLDIT